MSGYTWYGRNRGSKRTFPRGSAEQERTIEQESTDFRLDEKSGLFLPDNFKRPTPFGFRATE